MNQKTRLVISLGIMIVLTTLLLRSLFLNLAAFDRLSTQYFPVGNSFSLPLKTDKSSTGDEKTPEFPCYEKNRADWQIGWWYFAGHLEDEQNPAHKFGLTLVFDKNPAQIMFGLSDGEAQESFSGTINFTDYDIIEEESVIVKKDDIFWVYKGDSKYRISFKFEDKQIDLNLVSLKKPVIAANNEQTFYCQQTRLEAEGTLVIKDKHYQIKGQAWIEHQGFKDVLSWKSWRWHSLQLNNNIEIVFVTNFLDKSGNFSEKNALSIFDNQGRRETIEPGDYQIKDIEYFQYPQTNIRYPIKWQLEIPGRHIKLLVSSIVANQVIKGSDGFYEGSCQVSGIFEGENVSGRAQFEYMP